VPRYQKRPLVVDAVQWIVPFPKEPPIPPVPPTFLRRRRDAWQLKTLAGWVPLLPGDWILRYREGEYSRCQADRFISTYDLIEDTEFIWTEPKIYLPEGSQE